MESILESVSVYIAEYNIVIKNTYSFLRDGFKVFQNRLLRFASVPKRKQVTVRWKK